MCETEEHPITHRPHRRSVVSRELIHHRNGGHILMATATPRHAEEEKPPIVICNGYGAGINIVAHLASNLAEKHGRTVITYDEVRAKHARSDPIGFRADTVLSIIDRFDKGNDERYRLQPTLVGWSTGGAAATLATQRLVDEGEAERVGAVVPTASAAIGPQASEIELTARAAVEVARGLRSMKMVRALGAKAAHGFAGYVAKDIKLAVHEVVHLSRMDVRESLAAVRDVGIPMAVIAMRDDIIFPLAKKKAALEEHGLGEALRVLNGTHINMAWDHKVSQQVVQVIESLEPSRDAEAAA